MKIKEKSIYSGLDELIFKVSSEGWIAERPNVKLFNDYGESYCDFCFSSGAITVKLNLPRAMGRISNLFPYKSSIEDSTQLEIIRQQIVYVLDDIIDGKYTNKMTRAELSYLAEVETDEEVDAVCRLLADAFCEPKRQTKIFLNSNENGRGPIYSGYKSPVIKNKFIIKVYDKGKMEGLDRHYLRIEFVLQDRYLQGLQKNGLAMDIRNILAVKSLRLLYAEFPVCYEKYVKPQIGKHLSYTTLRLAGKMIACRHIIPVCQEMKSQIYCLKQVRRAVNLYARETGQTDNARNAAVHQVKKKFGFSDSVYDRLKEFENYIKN